MLDHRGKFLGQAHYSAASQIALRMLTRRRDPIDIAERIATAQRFREQVVTDSTAYRLVHAEADFLPALIIDRYGRCFAVQALDQGDGPRIARRSSRRSRHSSRRGDRGAQRCRRCVALEELPRETKLLAGFARWRRCRCR